MILTLLMGEISDLREPEALVGARKLNSVVRDQPRPQALGEAVTALPHHDEYVYEALRAGASGFLLKD